MEDKKPLDFIQVLPYIGSFIVFLGVTRLVLFYNQFGIRILNFLEFSEILTSFLDIIIMAVVIIVVSSVQRVLTEDIEQQQSQRLLVENIVNETQFFRRVKFYVRYLLPVVLIFAVTGAGFWLWNHYQHVTTDSQSLLGLYVLFGAVLFLIISLEIERRHRIRVSSIRYRQFISIAFYTVIFMMIDMYIAAYQVRRITKDKVYFGVKITLDDDVALKSDSSNYYIGNTKNYLFFYHEKTNNTEVYPMNRIKSLSFVNNFKNGIKVGYSH